MQLTPESPESKEPSQLIEEDIRVQENVVPIYEDIGGNLNRILANQNYFVFGRRGSGKPTLLLSAEAEAETSGLLCDSLQPYLLRDVIHL